MVFAVKEPLIAEFIERPAGKAPNGEVIDKPFYEVKYDFKLAKASRRRRRPKTSAIVMAGL